MKLLVRALSVEAEDVLSIELVSPQGDSLPVFTAGSHIDLELGNGLTRSYSLSSDPADCTRYVVAVNKDPGSRGGSRYIHETLRPGALIEVSGPRNGFPLVEDAPLVVLFAGGIGITPLWCMIQRLEVLGKPWKLYYSARNRAKCAYLREVQALEARSPGRVHIHFNEDAGGKVVDLDTLVAAQPEGAHLYCCGPVPMLQAFEQATAKRAPETVHVEYFAAAEEASTEGGFKVKLARSNRTVTVPSGKSILEALLDEGIEISHACKEGVCGACQTTVIEGEPDHRDSFLTPREKSQGKTVILCCSGSLSETLVLDL
jgi:tetrachlorobenzoquinone reductase